MKTGSIIFDGIAALLMGLLIGLLVIAPITVALGL